MLPEEPLFLGKLPEIFYMVIKGANQNRSFKDKFITKKEIWKT